VEPLLTLANLFYVSAYFVGRTLWLRALSLAGTVCLIVYFSSLPEPLMQVVYWNALFALINAVWVGRLLWARARRTRMSGAPDSAFPF
jgi:hypothetical protein